MCKRTGKDVLNICNIANNYQAIDNFLGHLLINEEKTHYYQVISYDKNDNIIAKTTILNHKKGYKEPYDFRGRDNLYCDKHKKAFICDGDMVFYCPECVKETNEFLKKNLYHRE